MTARSESPDVLHDERIKRQTRWVAAVLEGAGAACFIGILLREGTREPTAGPTYITFVVGAFLATALVAFLLWSMTTRGRGFSLRRATGFGALVVLLGSCLWLLAMSLIAYPPRWSGTFPYLSLLSEPGLSAVWLAKMLEGALLGAVLFGFITFPIGIAIALAVAIWGNSRLTALRR
jgi:hypothetical protein